MTSEQKASFAGMACAVVAALLLALVMAGCSTVTASAGEGTTARLWVYQSGSTLKWVSGSNSGIESAVLVDQETGVEYLLVSKKGGVSVTPLLNADGTPYKAVE